MAPKRPPPSPDDDDDDDGNEQQPPSSAEEQLPSLQQHKPKKLPSPPPKPKSIKLKPLPESVKVKPLQPGTNSTKEPETKEAKKSKKKKTETEPETDPAEKKQLFRRLWSEEDEMAVLKGIIEFKEEKGVDPAKEMGSFFGFIKGSLHFDVSLAQLKDKVWRLKRKFVKSVKRGSKGEDKTFSKEIDQLAFDLSKRIWGSHRIELRGRNPSGDGCSVKVGNVGDNHSKGGNNCANHSYGNDNRVSEYVRKKGLELMEGVDRGKMEKKWRELHVAELELFLKRNALVREQAKLILAAYETQDQ